MGQLHEWWLGLKAILMSGYAPDDTIRRRVDTGEIHFRQKPFDIATLAREIRTALGR